MAALLRIEAPHFVAGLVTDDDGTVVRAAPILGHMRNWSTMRVTAYCQTKRWYLTDGR